VAFESRAADLVAGDDNGAWDVFVRDRQTGTTERASLSVSWAQGDDDSDSASISADGRYVAFESWASNLVSSDTNACADVLVAEVVDVPTVTGLSKARGTILGGATVEITGTFFVGVTSVDFGGAAAVFTVESPTKIRATAPAHAEGTVQVRVTARGVPTEDTAVDDFTYSPATLYEQSEPQLTYLGAWNSSTEAPASGGDFAYAGSPGASLTISFEGSHLVWVAKTGRFYGQATVTLDGGDPSTVDLYGPVSLYQQEVYDTGALADGPHTLTLEFAGTKNAASIGYLVDVDAFEITGSLTQAPTPTRYQQDAVGFTYSGTWLKSWTWSASGGSFAYANSAGAAVNVRFEGIYLAWYAKTGPQYGRAQVSLDGGQPFYVDLYSAGSAYKRCVYNTGRLEAGVHTLSIYWSGLKNARGSGYLIDVDTFDILGEPREAPAAPPIPALYQQSDTHLTYLGPWSYAAQTPASGGSFTHTSVPGAAVAVSFTGTSVALVGKTAPDYGQALVRLDGGEAQTVDFYSATSHYQREVYTVSGLPDTAHTLTIDCAGLRNAASTGYLINVDALQITGYLTEAGKPTRYQQNALGLTYSGTWLKWWTWSASGGSFTYANSAGSAVDVEFEGTYLAWYAKTGPQYGRAQVSLDRGAPFYVDLYSAVSTYKRCVYNTGTLEAGTHTLSITWGGVKNARSTGYLIDVDAFDLLGTPID
jgi:hypothetical protein